MPEGLLQENKRAADRMEIPVTIRMVLYFLISQ
jgi:hypothetical protein